MGLVNTRPYKPVGGQSGDRAYFFTGDDLTAGRYSITNVYQFSNNSVATTVELDPARTHTAGVGNVDVAIICGSNNDGNTFVFTTSKYTYSTDLFSDGTDLSVRRRQCTGTGNATVGYLSTGQDPDLPGFTTSSDKYVYATDARTEASSAYYGNWFGFGGGHQTEGFTWDDTGANGKKTVYSTEAVSSIASLSVSGQGTACCSNELIALITGGSGSVADVKKYTFNNNTSASATALSVDKRSHHSAGDATVGIVGSYFGSAYTEKYEYATTTVIVGTALLLRHGGIGLSNCHGGL